MPWRIASWSRALGRGTIESEHYRDVPFDGACADVDDFRVGELVIVETESVAGALRVARVSPDEPRFRAPRDSQRAPSLAEDLRARAEETLTQCRGCIDYRIGSLSEDALVIEGDDAAFEYGHERELTIQAPSYLELSLRFDLKHMRLSTDEERAYLHSHKATLSEREIAITVIDEEGRFYFVVGASISRTR
jgi:hypothetical protein